MSINLDDFRRGHLFNENGKWKYDVWLHYGIADNFDYGNWDLWGEARKALTRATKMGVSGVTLMTIPAGWMLVVPEPYSKFAHPIMMTGGEKT